MAELHTIQPSFTRGELSPSMYARVDTAHYGVGCKTMENFFVHPARVEQAIQQELSILLQPSHQQVR